MEQNPVLFGLVLAEYSTHICHILARMMVFVYYFWIPACIFAAFFSQWSVLFITSGHQQTGIPNP